MQKVAKKRSSVDVNLLSDSEEEISSFDDDPYKSILPLISSGDDSKKDLVEGIPTITNVDSNGGGVAGTSDDDTVDYRDYRPSKHECYDVHAWNNQNKDDAGGNFTGRQTEQSAQGYKAEIPLMGKPKVCCYNIDKLPAGCNLWTNSGFKPN